MRVWERPEDEFVNISVASRILTGHEANSEQDCKAKPTFAASEGDSYHGCSNFECGLRRFVGTFEGNAQRSNGHNLSYGRQECEEKQYRARDSGSELQRRGSWVVRNIWWWKVDVDTFAKYHQFWGNSQLVPASQQWVSSASLALSRVSPELLGMPPPVIHLLLHLNYPQGRCLRGHQGSY
jgi:hypothetical protein